MVFELNNKQKPDIEEINSAVSGFVVRLLCNDNSKHKAKLSK